MKNKLCFLFTVLAFFFSYRLSCFAETDVIKIDKLSQLIQLVLDHSPELKEAELIYNHSIINYQTKEGLYSPDVSVSAGSLYNSRDVEVLKDNLYAALEISQILPTGTKLGLSGSYPINKSETKPLECE